MCVLQRSFCVVAGQSALLLFHPTVLPPKLARSLSLSLSLSLALSLSRSVSLSVSLCVYACAMNACLENQASLQIATLSLVVLSNRICRVEDREK